MKLTALLVMASLVGTAVVQEVRTERITRSENDDRGNVQGLWDDLRAALNRGTEREALAASDGQRQLALHKIGQAITSRLLENRTAVNLPKLEDAPMVTPRQQGSTLPVRHLSISIARPMQEVYDFVSDPANYVPAWAAGPEGLISYENGDLIAHAPAGKVRMRFAPKNSLGVLDYDFIFESGATVHQSMRVIPNGAGSEMVRTVVRAPHLSDDEFADEVAWVEQDLAKFKQLLEE